MSFKVNFSWIAAIEFQINPLSTKKVTLSTYNSQTTGGETQDDRENRILSLLRSGSYQSYIRQMSGISRKSGMINSMARRALMNSIGPIASTETCPEEDEFEAGLEDENDAQDDDVFSPISPEVPENQGESPHDSPKGSPIEIPDSPETNMKEPSFVSFKDAGSLRHSPCKRISTPLAGKILPSFSVLLNTG